MELNEITVFGNKQLFICRLATEDRNKALIVDQFLDHLSELCDFQLVTLNDLMTLERETSVVLFLVSSLDHFQLITTAVELDQKIIKIVAYFLDRKEFRKVDSADFRRPLKALSYNIIYPDNKEHDDYIHPSALKAYDTVYSRTVRKKFESENDGDIQVNNLIVKALADMRLIAWHIRDMGLNHADSFAGLIAIRVGKDILITASQTDKYHIEIDRTCLININQQGNIIHYKGKYSPSSETRLVQRAMNIFTNINYFVHFHSKPITENSRLKQYQTARFESYGTPAETDLLIEKLQQTNSFAIANSHGEFVIADDVTQVLKIIDKVEKFIENGH